MTAASIVPGFFRVGSPEKPDVNPDGVQKLIQQIPAKDVLAIQKYLAQYEKDYNENGFDRVVQAMTGINLDLFKYDNWGEVIFAGPITVYRAEKMFAEMAVKIPKLLGKIGLLVKNMDPILQEGSS